MKLCEFQTWICQEGARCYTVWKACDVISILKNLSHVQDQGIKHNPVHPRFFKCCDVQCCDVQCCDIQCCAVMYSVVMYNAVMCCIMQQSDTAVPHLAPRPTASLPSAPRIISMSSRTSASVASVALGSKGRTCSGLGVSMI